MGKIHERKEYCFWCDGNIRVYYNSDGRWRDNNGIDRSYLFDRQDNYLSYRGKNKGHDKGKHKGARDGKGKHKETSGWVRRWERQEQRDERVGAERGALQATGLDAVHNVIWMFSEEPVEATAAVEATVEALGYAGTFPDPAAADEDGESKPVSESPSLAVSQENGEKDEELEWGPPEEDARSEPAEDASMLQKFMVEETALRQFVTQSRASVDLEKATKMWWMETIANMSITDLAKLTCMSENLITMEKFPSFVLRMKWKQWHSSQFEDSIFGDEDEEF
jgi:hypothetical protein